MSDFKARDLTTNLGVRSSNLFGRAKNSGNTGLSIYSYRNVTVSVTIRKRIADRRGCVFRSRRHPSAILRRQGFFQLWKSDRIDQRKRRPGHPRQDRQMNRSPRK
jgi:hypothetical protein